MSRTPIQALYGLFLGIPGSGSFWATALAGSMLTTFHEWLPRLCLHPASEGTEAPGREVAEGSQLQPGEAAGVLGCVSVNACIPVCWP
jgi:hypothetical protein